MIKLMNILLFLHIYSSSANPCNLPNECRLENLKSKSKINSIIQLDCKTLKPNYDYAIYNEAKNKSCELKSKRLEKFTIHLSNEKGEKELIEDHLIDLFRIFEYESAAQYEIRIENVKGFRLNSSSSIQVELDMYFSETNFDFYDLNGTLIRSCEQFFESGTNGFFSENEFARLVFWDVSYRTPICPFVFNYSIVFSLEVNFLVKSYFKWNQMEFEVVEAEKEPTWEIFELSLHNSYRLDLDSRLLDEQMFKEIGSLEIGGSVNSVEAGVFKNMKNLKKIRLPADYFIDLSRRQGIEWIKDLNSRVKVDINNPIPGTTKSKQLLMFVVYLEVLRENLLDRRFQMAYDEDLCLFKEFPFDQFIVVWFNHPQDEEAPYLKQPSCATLWLSQYYMQFAAFKAVYSESDINALNRSDFASCDFKNRFKLCKKENFVSSENKPTDFTPLDFMIVSEFTLIIFSRLISLIGIILSVLAIIVLVKGKGSKENQYHYMVIYSVSNIFIFIVQITSLLNECQFPFGIFCSGVYRSLPAQYFKIIAVEYFIAFFRLLSNLIYVAYALNRLSLVGKEHNPVTKFISELDIRIYLGVSILISGGLTVVKAFRFEVSDDVLLYVPSLFTIKNIVKTWVDTWIDEPGYKALFILNVIYDFINYIVFTLVNLAIDLSLIFKFRKVLNEKLEKHKEHDKKVQERVKKENKESMRRVIQMVVLNSTVNVLFKLPVIITTLHDFRLLLENNLTVEYYNILAAKRWYSFPYSMKYFCSEERSCEIFENFGNSLFLSSLGVNFFFLKHFDKNFSFAYDETIRGKETDKNRPGSIKSTTRRSTMKSSTKAKKSTTTTTK